MDTPNTIPLPGNQRILALDTLRFIAAIIVVFEHCNSVYSMVPKLPFFLAGFFNAKSAVAFFFVLSGYVLHLSLKNKTLTPRSYASFMVKRVFRLYPLFYVSLALGALVLLGLPLSSIESLVNSYFTYETIRQNHHDVFQWLMQTTMVMPPIENTFFNPPMWTLTAELRISILFPLLSALLAILHWRIALAVTLLIFCASPTLADFTIPTIGMIPLFALGIILARLVETKPAMKVPTAGLLVTGILLYCAATWLDRKSIGVLGQFYVAGLGSAMIMLATIKNSFLSTSLSRPWLVSLGQCSYGIYILHFPILLLTAYGFSFIKVPAFIFFGTVLVLTTLVSLLLYGLVEVPFINMGRKLAKKI
ncbi:acyltransferase [Prosthecobacter sp. SYSU 5D2]|uniref:acyltransferase family protein n=1 Tax=Prosthecobacter sp. SYSU 5D2 TaxID=3134134 RepID=UPI0031FF309D